MKKLLILLLCSMMIINLSGCSAFEKAKDTVIKTKDDVTEYISNIDFSSFKNGWSFISGYAVSLYSAAVSNQYVQKVSDSITTFANDINSRFGSGKTIDSEAGTIAEKWSVDTFNINATAAGTGESATQVNSYEYASADIATSWGEEYSSKYYANATESAKAQAESIYQKYCEYAAKQSRNNQEAISFEEYLNERGLSEVDDIYQSLYYGQTKLIPSDQLDDAIKYLQNKLNKESVNRPELAPGLQESLDTLADKITSPEGVESIPLSKEEAQMVAQMAKEGKFDPSEFGIKTSTMINPKYVVKQAMGAGLSGAELKMILSIGPDIVSIIYKAIKDGEIDLTKLKTTGIKGLFSGLEGFAEGSISYVLVSLCKSGQLGKLLVDATPEMIGAFTVVLIESVGYTYALAKGDITPNDFSNFLAESITVSAISVATGTALSTAFPGLKIAYLLGSFAGGLLASSAYEKAKEVIIEIKDGGGFAAIVPQGTVEVLSIAKDTIKNLNIKESVSNFGNMVISTLNDGAVRIFGKEEQQN